ncbi:hypothetical protein SELMODRAFT_419612 [Selaginella moellendorffii]|uniref:Uncharacterized protein n=1 Tax=Selaginella moellendorffii TaxID=88036 RepID=D8S9H6_SELML|nr:hypothetical protein SELMODRAFT_419612 [Selaginella moellendorffii]
MAIHGSSRALPLGFLSTICPRCVALAADEELQRSSGMQLSASPALLAAASVVWQWAQDSPPVTLEKQESLQDFHKDICALLQQAALTLSQKPPESMLLSVTLGERMIAPQQQRTGEFPRGKLLRARRLSVNAVKVKDGNLVGSPARQVLSPVPETKESGRGEGFVRIRDGGSGKRQNTAKQIEEIALGLEASKVPFLWVIRSNSVLRMDEEGREARFKLTKLRFILVKPLSGFEVSTIVSFYGKDDAQKPVEELELKYINPQHVDYQKPFKVGQLSKDTLVTKAIVRSNLRYYKFRLWGNIEYPCQWWFPMGHYDQDKPNPKSRELTIRYFDVKNEGKLTLAPQCKLKVFERTSTRHSECEEFDLHNLPQKKQPSIRQKKLPSRWDFVKKLLYFALKVFRRN